MPGNFTSKLQPLHISVNGRFKDFLRDSVTDWYADCVLCAVQEFGDDAETAVQALRPDLRLTYLKLIHAKRVIECIAQFFISPSVVC